MKLATVDPISEKISWNAKAVGGDIIERAPIDSPVFAIWRDKDGFSHYSKANTTVNDLCYFAIILQKMAQECVSKSELEP